MRRLSGKTIALCVTGSIAAYKAAHLARLLLAEGAVVLPVMTESSEAFLGPTTLAGLTGEPVRRTMWDPSFPGEMHVTLADRADAVAIVPATADVLARLASGRADDLVAALALVAKGPVFAAPAMHPRMWVHPATRANVARLHAHGRVRLVGPVSGLVASGDVGEGRMIDPEAIRDEIVRTLTAPHDVKDLEGVRLLVTAGPTVEDLDPVRFLGNRSTGKMGFALARRAASRGARVTLVTGPVTLAPPPDVHVVPVRSALEMERALDDVAGDDLHSIDALVMAAAVADYRPAAVSSTKVKKGDERTTLELVRNPDLLAGVGARRARLGGEKLPVLVGFAVETGSDDEVAAYAAKKLAAKQCDFVVANAAAESFGRDDNRAAIVTAEGAAWLPPLDKLELADRILDAILDRLAGARGL